MTERPGTIRLFQVKGITVFLHWTWLIVAIFEISSRSDTYSKPFWNVVEYLALFGIVTLHEFGHALACRSVGGRADQILLWPLGGVAFVDPPTRPGATLWSIAAGPLVNVALVPVLGALTILTSPDMSADAHALLRSVTFINIGLLAFNLLPVYPLDGGQILGALLWFVLGRARSIVVTAYIGLVGVAGIGWLALRSLSVWLGFIAVFVAQRCLGSLKLARSLNAMAEVPRRQDRVCPSCGGRPPIGRFWACASCGAAFDVFDPSAAAPAAMSETTRLSLSADMSATYEVGTETRCPACHTETAAMKCLQCDAVTPIANWHAAAAASPLPGSLPVTRVRPPQRPSVAPIAIGAGLTILALTAFFLAIVFSEFSARGANVDVAFTRRLAIALAVLGLLPGAGALALALRYRRSWRTFDSALQRFRHDRLSAQP